MKEWVLDGVGILSAKVSEVELADDLEGLAGLLAAAELIRDRMNAALAGRVQQFAIDQAKSEARAELGW